MSTGCQLKSGAVIILGSLLVVAAANRSEEAERYPFEGTWRCREMDIILTRNTYEHDSKPLTIQKVLRNGRNYRLLFRGGGEFDLLDVREGSMTCFSPQSGDDFECRRIFDHQKLLDQVHNANQICRGNTGDDPETHAWCKVREALSAVLEL